MNTAQKYVEILTPLLAVLTALIIGGIIIQLNGVNAFEAYGQLFKSAFYQANPKAPFMSGLAKTLLTVLGQVADTHARPLIHRFVRDIAVVESDFAAVWLYQTDNHVEGGGFAGTVETKQPDDFALFYVQRYIVGDLAAFVGFTDRMNDNFVKRRVDRYDC